MKISMSADCFYPAQVGGPSSAIYWQAKALTKAGHNVTVVATSHYLPPAVRLNQWLTTDCGQVIYTRNPHFYLPFVHVWYSWRAIRQSDVVHVNSLFYPASIVWVILSRLMNKPVVWSPHGELSPAALRFRPRLKKRLLQLFRYCSASVCFHTTSEAETFDVRSHFGPNSRVHEIRNMLELPVPLTPNPPQEPYLLFIGRLHPIKAIDRLIEAVSMSTQFCERSYRLRIVGPEDDKAYSRKLRELVHALHLESKIIIEEAVYGTMKEQLYADAFITILPSHSENFGNVVIESLAQGTPVIASTGTPWQLLATERAGSWVSNEPESLRQAIETYLTMPANDYADYRKRAIELARRHYDILQNIDVWIRFYQTILDERTDVQPKRH
ncbi:glycosyltransferase [Spirosoma sp. KNUC1025]|uniref:glycosyltransferase n=1 Tax=Spirosoma sp. KNUC1025 TaxID=2894082 RepID=UPI003867BD2E|nr:glycosyltransferase [Spirosoma sp. KNUC1025]